MTTVQKIAPNDERRAAIYLVAATAVIIALVCAVALVIYIGTKPAVSSGPAPSMSQSQAASALTPATGAHPMSAAQWATAPALLPTASKARRQACLAAIDRASASRNLSSQAAIEASTNMLRICNAA